MNLNNIEKEEKKEESQEISEGMKIFLSAGVKNPWWDRSEPLENVDCTKIQVRESEFKGEKRKNKDGEQIYELVLTLVDNHDNVHFVSYTYFSKMWIAFQLALDKYGCSKYTEVLGKNINLKCTGKQDNAYTYEAKINCDSNHEVEGLFDINGNQRFKEEK